MVEFHDCSGRTIPIKSSLWRLGRYPTQCNVYAYLEWCVRSCISSTTYRWDDYVLMFPATRMPFLVLFFGADEIISVLLAVKNETSIKLLVQSPSQVPEGFRTSWCQFTTAVSGATISCIVSCRGSFPDIHKSWSAIDGWKCQTCNWFPWKHTHETTYGLHTGEYLISCWTRWHRLFGTNGLPKRD